MKNIVLLSLTLFTTGVFAQNPKNFQVQTIPVTEVQLNMLKRYDPQIHFFTSSSNPVTSINELTTGNISISTIDLISFYSNFCKDFNLAKFTPGTYTGIEISLVKPDEIFYGSNPKIRFYIAKNNQVDSIRNAILIEFKVDTSDKLSSILHEVGVYSTDTLFKIKETGVVNFVEIGSETDSKLYQPEPNSSFCYVSLFLKNLGDRHFTLNLNKLKLVDQSNAEFSVFGVAAVNFQEISLNTRTQFSGGKTASIDLFESFQSDVKCIHLHQIIRDYNLGSNTISTQGGISITGNQPGSFSVSSGEYHNNITFSKTPSIFTLAFIVPKGAKSFELKFEKDAYCFQTPINISGKNILEYNEGTRQAKGGSRLVFLNNGIKPVEIGDIFLENSLVNSQTLRFNKLSASKATPGAYLKSSDKESFVLVEIYNDGSKTTVYPTNSFKLITDENIFGNMNSVLTITREYENNTIERYFTVNKYSDYEVFKDFGSKWNDPKLGELSNKDFMVKSDGETYNIYSIENPSVSFPLAVKKPTAADAKQKPSTSQNAISKQQEQNISLGKERWPHKKTIALEFGYIAMFELIGENETLIIEDEDEFLKSLGLVWQETSNGVVTSSNPIDSYTYSGGIIGGLRFSYYLNNRLALGGSLRFYQYGQSLTIGDDTAEADFIDISLFGPNFNYSLYHKKRFGLTLKSDISLVTGNLETVPVLKIFNDKNLFEGLTGLTNLINNQNSTTTLSGFQLNTGISANYFIARWFSIDAGIHLHYFQAEASENLWASSSKTFSTFSIPFYFGMNFLIGNKH